MEAFENRPDPDALLSAAHKKNNTDQNIKRGKLKIFLGYAAGVGKTYAMLDDARSRLAAGTDTVIGYVEPHTRPDTMRLLSGLPQIPPLSIQYKNITLREFDLETALRRKPALILVDELAHTNAAGVRNKKRYQDVEELLNAGIDVYTTLNVQHLESLNDMVEDIAKIPVRETVPDYVFDDAGYVKLVDITPEELLTRFEQGKIYRTEQAASAMQHFFTTENLRSLREIALRKAAEHVSHDGREHDAEKTLSQRFLVCIGPSPSSARCIRWTARTAEAFRAPWTVLCVETPESSLYTEKEKKQIRDHLDLAARLGAQIVTPGGTRVAETVAAYAKAAGITNIVIGKSRKRKTLRLLFEDDLEDQLISLLSDVEVFILPDHGDDASVKHRRRLRWSKNLVFSWYDTIKTAGILTAATLVSLFLQARGVGDQNTIMVYLLCVLIISRFTTGYAYGILASLLSVLTFDFLFIEPHFTLSALQAGYPLTFGIMLLVALLTSALMIRIKTQAVFAATHERRTELLYEINKKLLVIRNLPDIIALINTYITTLFGRSTVFYTEDPAGGTPGTVCPVPSDKTSDVLRSPDEQAVAHWVFVNKKRAGAGTDTLMGASGYYMPVLAQGNVLGVLGVRCDGKTPLDHDSRAFLRMIASLVAMSLERQRLSDEQRRILIETEKESMRSNLLRAISHDLRTPLTAISGASCAILENENTMDRETREKLLRDIRDDSQWLIRMVENLLSVTRISAAPAGVVKTPQAAEEVISESVRRVKGKFDGCNIQVRVPDELLTVPMDATLIEQVIINLLENAVKHSEKGTPIELSVKRSADTAVFEVLDHGEGIAAEELPVIFDGYAGGRDRTPDASRGLGIGLSICRSIIKAHNGQIEAENRPQGGALFRFILPLEGEEAHGE